MYKILVCDDERDIVNALKIYLTGEGYDVLEAYNGCEALDILNRCNGVNSDGTEAIHLVLMDIMMPQMDGIEAMVELRKSYNIPVILLTAKSEDMDKVLGLNVGADDYITKPFNPVELIARVKSQLRRYMMLGGAQMQVVPEEEARQKLIIGGIELDDRSKEVTLDGENVNLTPREYDILKLLMKHPGKVYSPQEIYQEVWQDPAYGTENTVAVHVRHLREKLEYDPANPRYLIAVWGHGYKMCDN
ncbi:MAG: response regulator transcription factor [Lachnospiraceae bacterium]|nr:response regulator transcription factor [Lachnospiraceae bacterium]